MVADLDGDGKQEILFSSYDGRVHAYWLDKTEHGSWPYSVYKPAEGFYRFASEPVVADLDCDGKAEVLFTSWVPNGSNRTGKLHILSDNGQVLHEVDLPMAFSGNWNGGMAAPTLANVDTDADLEIVINTDSIRRGGLRSAGHVRGVQPAVADRARELRPDGEPIRKVTG